VSLDVVAFKKAIPLFGVWVKPLAYLKEKSRGDNSMPIKRI